MTNRGDPVWPAGNTDWQCTDSEWIDDVNRTVRLWEAGAISDERYQAELEYDFLRLVYRPDNRSRIAHTWKEWDAHPDGDRWSAVFREMMRESIPSFAQSNEPLNRQVSKICGRMLLAFRAWGKDHPATEQAAHSVHEVATVHEPTIAANES